MALQYNHLISQEELIREPKIRVYTYERCSSKETKPEDRERYPNMYKIFNNKPSFSDPDARSPRASRVATLPTKTVEYVKYGGDLGSMSQRPESPQPKDHVFPHREATMFEGYKSQHTWMPAKTVVEPVFSDTDARSPRASQIATLPTKTVEYVKYGGDLGSMSQRPESPQPKDHVFPRREATMFEGYKSQQAWMPATTVVEPVFNDLDARSPRASQIATLPTKTVEYVKYGGDLGFVSQRPEYPQQPHDHMIPRRERTRSEGYKSQQTRIPANTVVEPVKYDEVARDHDENKGECINAAAAGFIEWKKRTLQFCY